MVVEVGADGGVRLYARPNQAGPYEASDRPAWERAVAETYTNDRQCGTCGKVRGTGYLTKDTAYITHGQRIVTGAMVYCSRCGIQVVRFRLQNKNHFFVFPSAVRV